jgi:hypothetical protein
MCPIIRAVQLLAQLPYRDREALATIARAAIEERDRLRLRIHELEKKTRDTPKHQGMTELA